MAAGSLCRAAHVQHTVARCGGEEKKASLKAMLDALHPRLLVMAALKTNGIGVLQLDASSVALNSQD
uniref:Uncharacterized protein n=1 Tax=Oryza punctata TaxID=4537 RepID=A0A0E0JID2_ORYPU